jgi:GntR family transcriptional regulator, histidine utilization repressor
MPVATTDPTPLPLYAKVKNHVLQQIRSGEHRPGARVQSEHELVRELRVSRMTVNRAVRELVRSGVLSRIAGVGTFVADFRAAGHPLQIRNIAAEIRERGHRHHARIVTLEKVAAPAAIRDRLALPAATRQVFHSLIVHFENDVPLQVEDRYVNPAVAPDYLQADFASITPHEYLMEVAPLRRVEHVVRAALPPAPIGRLLKLKPHEAALVIERTTWSKTARASFATLHHPGGRFELRGVFDI